MKQVGSGYTPRPDADEINIKLVNGSRNSAKDFCAASPENGSGFYGRYSDGQV
jgi:hypothetical protein